MASLNTARLKTQLLNTGLQQKDNPLYQVILSLIGALESLETTVNSGGGGSATTNNINNTINQILGGAAFDVQDGQDSYVPGPAGPQGIQGMQGPPGREGDENESFYVIVTGP